MTQDDGHGDTDQAGHDGTAGSSDGRSDGSETGDTDRNRNGSGQRSDGVDHSHTSDGQHDSHHGHSHGPRFDGEAGDWYTRFRRWLSEWLHGLYHGMIEHPAFEKIEKEAEDVEDEFFFACFADAFGIPSPISYYTVELLPYLAEDFEAWERRMWDRETLLERKGQQYHFH